jgi:hypothetical protein
MFRWVPGSDLCMDADYSDCGDVPYVLQADARWYLKVSHDHFLQHPFQFIIL